jgi:hypothetical protein
MNDDHPSKDQFFERLGALADAMVAAYGKEFAMGAMILAARFIAEGRPPGSDLSGRESQKSGPTSSTAPR